MRRLSVVCTLFLCGCSAFWSDAKKIEFAPTGFYNSTYEEVARGRMLLEATHNLLAVVAKYMLGERWPQASMEVQLLDARIKPPRPIEQAVTLDKLLSDLLPTELTGGLMNLYNQSPALYTAVTGSGLGMLVLGAVWRMWAAYRKRKDEEEAEAQAEKERKERWQREEEHRKLLEQVLVKKNGIV